MKPIAAAGVGPEAIGNKGAPVFNGAGKPRPVSRGAGVIVALGAAALLAGCTAAVADPAPGTGAGAAVPTVTPAAVPVLGPMSLGTFPATEDGVAALSVCEQWAGLRADYVPRLRRDSAYQLEQWFSSATWLAAFTANSPLKIDPRYQYISTAFGLASTAAAASVDSARRLDAACAAAD
jgi:hypothetical protein